MSLLAERRPRTPMWHRVLSAAVVSILALVATVLPAAGTGATVAHPPGPAAEAASGAVHQPAALPPFDAPADTASIEPVGAPQVIDGWRWQHYRNPAYPCAISGYQTFALGAPVDDPLDEPRPLWVRLRGGGVGWFDPDGSPQPGTHNKTEESLDRLRESDRAGVLGDAKDHPVGFRLLLVSMCSHDLYAGNLTPDPHNPNLAGAGLPRPTTGLPATTAAVRYATETFPTTASILHGTSAGGIGTYHVAWSLQRQGLAPAGLISDSGVQNQAWATAVAAAGIDGTSGCANHTADRVAAVLPRLDPTVTDPANQPHHLVADGRLTVPVLHVWSRGDHTLCGDVTIACPLADGTTVPLWAADCVHEPVRRAIEAQGPSSPSLALRLCVAGGNTGIECDRHVVTSGNLRNTDPSQPEDFAPVIVDWAVQRVAAATFEPGPCGEGIAGPFPDVGAHHPFCAEVQWLVQEGVTTGYADGMFRPTAPTTRQAMAAFLWRVAGEPAPPDVPPATPTFADVPAGHPFADPIEWMAASGLATGTAQPDGTSLFRPASTMSRQAMAAFLWRAAAEPTPPSVQPHFPDVVGANPFFEAVQWMGMAGLSTGSPRPGERPAFLPTDAVSRQAMAAFLFRADRLDAAPCGVEAALGHIGAVVSLARLHPGGTWVLDGPATAFDERTATAEVFRDRLGFDCAIRATQSTSQGERHVVAAWTGMRFAAVVQASDAPSTPYAPQALFDLLVEEVRGEHLEGGTYRNPERTVWAGTATGGESIVVVALDTSMGATAKAWVADVDPGSTDHLVTLPSEQLGIDTLRAVGARNVGLAELPEVGSEIGTLAAVSPTGQLLEVRVAPVGWIDPTTDWLGSGTTAQQLAGIDVWVVERGPGEGPFSFDVAHVSFECGPWVWHVITGYGTTAELLDVVATIIGELDSAVGCA